MIKQRLTRFAVAAVIAVGTLGATLAGAAQHAAPAAAQSWHGGDQRGHWDRDHRWHDQGWRDGNGRWHGYGPGPGPAYYAPHGPRYYDRGHGYWRDSAGYWDPHSGVYLRFGF